MPSVRRDFYFGRTGIFELLVITEPLRDMIRENPSQNRIKAEARKNGMIYLQEDGLRQVIQGADIHRGTFARGQVGLRTGSCREQSGRGSDLVASRSGRGTKIRSGPGSIFKRQELPHVRTKRPHRGGFIVFLILLMTYALAGEGLWGAAPMLFNVLFSGTPSRLISTNRWRWS